MSSEPGRLSRVGAGRVLITAAALFPAIGAFAADWNETHVFNPSWPPHAKFHNAQTISLAVLASAVSVWQLWRPGQFDRPRLRWATLFAALFWLTQVPAPFFPGSSVVDPESPVQPFTVLGLPVNQVTAIGAVLLPLLGAGYILETRRLRTQRSPSSAGRPAGDPGRVGVTRATEHPH